MHAQRVVIYLQNHKKKDASVLNGNFLELFMRPTKIDKTVISSCFFNLHVMNRYQMLRKFTSIHELGGHSVYQVYFQIS